MDFRIGDGGSEQQDYFKLQCALVLTSLLQESDALGQLDQMDTLLSDLVADGDRGADSMTPMHLAELVPGGS